MASAKAVRSASSASTPTSGPARRSSPRASRRRPSTSTRSAERRGPARHDHTGIRSSATYAGASSLREFAERALVGSSRPPATRRASRSHWYALPVSWWAPWRRPADGREARCQPAPRLPSLRGRLYRRRVASSTVRRARDPEDVLEEEHAHRAAVRVERACDVAPRGPHGRERVLEVHLRVERDELSDALRRDRYVVLVRPEVDDVLDVHVARRVAVRHEHVAGEAALGDGTLDVLGGGVLGQGDEVGHRHGHVLDLLLRELERHHELAVVGERALAAGLLHDGLDLFDGVALTASSFGSTLNSRNTPFAASFRPTTTQCSRARCTRASARA